MVSVVRVFEKQAISLLAKGPRSGHPATALVCMCDFLRGSDLVTAPFFDLTDARRDRILVAF